MPGSPLYVLQIAVETLRAQVLVNDIEVFSEPAGAERQSALKINPYVIEGQNTLGVVLGPVVERGEEDRKTLRTGVFEALLLHGEHGKEPGADGELLSYAWSAAEAPLLTEALLPVWRREFLPRETFGRWRWQDATPFKPADEDAVKQLVQRFYTTLLKRDAAALSVMCRTKTEELARALDLSVDEIEQQQAAHYASYFQSPDWQVSFIAPEEVRLRSMAGGRLVAVTNLRGGPVLQGTDRERPFAFPMRVAKLDGQWTLVR